MSKLFYKVVTLSVEKENLNSESETVLLNLFEYIIKRQATTLARKSFYEMRDFDTAVNAGLSDFSLCITRNPGKQEYWLGSFEFEDKKLEIMAMLERD